MSSNLIGMNTITKQVSEIELHCLERRFEHVRINNPTRVNQLTTLIAQQGQQVPVVVVAHEQPHRWILIDGYLRMSALKRLGQDTIQAEHWKCDVAQALLVSMAHQQNRSFEAIEEALLLQELQCQFGLTQAVIANQTGRSKTWVSHRLQLIEGFSEKILNAIRNGAISSWVANRVFAPFARANTTHAELFLDYLFKHHHSSRELHQFFEHYKTSPPRVREKMVNESGLFFQSKRALLHEKKAAVFIPEVERNWLSPLQGIEKQLQQLQSCVEKFFYTGQSLEERCLLLQSFEKAQKQIQVLDNRIRSTIHD